MKYIGFILLAVIIAIILLLLIAVIRTLLMPGKTSSYVAEEPEEESLVLAQKLSKMIQYDTTSHANVAEVEKFLGFHKVLEELFPLVHEKLEKTEIDGNLLFRRYCGRKGMGARRVRYQMLCDGIFPGSGRIVGRGLRTTHGCLSGKFLYGRVGWGRCTEDRSGAAAQGD